MVANDNCSACEFQNGLASSRRYDENRLERNRKPLGRRVQHSNGWRGGSEPNLFKHVGLEAREIPAVEEVFSLCFPLYKTTSLPQAARIPTASRFVFRDGFGGSLPQPPYFSGGPRRGFTFGLPAHRSFGHKKYRTVRKEKKEWPYILGLKTPRLFLNSYTMDSGLRLPPSTIPCEAEDVSVPCRRSQTAAIIPRISRINSLLDLRFSHQASGSKSPSRALATRTSMPRGKTCRKMYR